MPQVFKIGSYLVYFWANEGKPTEPVHVHACKGKPHKDATKIWMEEVPRLEHNKSEIPAHDLSRIMQWLAVNRDFVISKWNEHFD